MAAKHSRWLVALVLMTHAAGAHAQTAPEPIRYTLSFPAPQTHYVEVTATVPTGRRASIDMMMAVWTPGSYLVREYSRNVEAVTAAAPDGHALDVDKSRCTMCLACVGSCPEGAILDNAESPQLRFIESKCVQCGICAATCPEDAITLTPRLSLAPEARQPRVINVAVVVHCSACGKPLGTEKMLAGMLAKLAGHSMFAAPGALDRLRMCADCRVIDLMKNERGLDIRDI